MTSPIEHVPTLRERARRPLALLAVGGPLLVVLVMSVVVLPRVRASCPSPAPVEAGDAAAISRESLVAKLPASLTGFSPEAPQVTTPGWMFAGDALHPNGFRYGFTQLHTHTDSRVDLSVLQFATAAGARAFDAADIHELCRSAHRGLSLPEGTSGSAVAARSESGTITRVSLIRGSRDYVIVIRGPAIPRTLRFDLVRVVDRLAS